MARQTRAQRRARREQQTAQAAAAPVARRDGAPERQPRPLPEPARDQAARAPRVPGRFIAESWGELRKVEWPGQKQVIQGTIVVLIACAIVGTYLWGADLVLKRFVQNVLLGQ